MLVLPAGPPAGAASRSDRTRDLRRGAAPAIPGREAPAARRAARRRQAARILVPAHRRQDPGRGPDRWQAAHPPAPRSQAAARSGPLLQIVQTGQDPAVLPGKPEQEPALPRRHRAQHHDGGGEPELRGVQMARPSGPGSGPMRRVRPAPRHRRPRRHAISDLGAPAHRRRVEPPEAMTVRCGPARHTHADRGHEHSQQPGRSQGTPPCARRDQETGGDRPAQPRAAGRAGRPGRPAGHAEALQRAAGPGSIRSFAVPATAKTAASTSRTPRTKTRHDVLLRSGAGAAAPWPPLAENPGMPSRIHRCAITPAAYPGTTGRSRAPSHPGGAALTASCGLVRRSHLAAGQASAGAN